MLVSLASILINLAVASTMVKLAGLGHLGLALSTSAVALFGSVALFLLLRKRIQRHARAGAGGQRGEDSGRFGSHGSWRVISPAAASITGWATRKVAQLADVAVSIPLGALVYYAAVPRAARGGARGRLAGAGAPLARD